MDEFQQKRKFRRILYSKASIIVLAIIALFVVRGTWVILDKQIQSKKKMEAVQRQLTHAKDRESEIQKNINRLNTPQGTESEIRERYSVKKDGEDVVIVVESETSTSTPLKTISFWEKVGNWFRDLLR